MTEAVEKRAIAFIRTIGNRCTTCLRRSAENCRGCISAWANEILHDYENERTPEIDYSLSARMMMIADALDKAGRPLASHEIHLADYCTKQLKYWTLSAMVRKGWLQRRRSRVDGRDVYLYSLSKRSKPQ